jgi:hypothetical protein
LPLERRWPAVPSTSGVAVIVRWETDHDYVLVHVHQDMFGDWIFIRAWGQIGTQLGGLKHQLADDHDQALMWLADETTILSSRGFRKVLEVADESAEGREAAKQLSLLEM